MRVLSIALAVAVVAPVGCTFGVGPQVGLSKRGVTVALQGGGGPGGRSYGVRGDVGLIVVPGDDGGAFVLAGATAFAVASPDSKYTGGAFAGIVGTRAGAIVDAGAIGVRFNRPPVEMECSGQGWAVAIGVRRLPDRYELFVWPQYLAYDGSDC